MIYYTSDWHLGHENILEFEPNRRKLGSTIDEMNEAIIARHNSKVKPTDLCIFLGDLAFASSGRIKEWLARTNGRKILVVGNHDGHTPSQFMKIGFDWVCQEMVVKIAGKFVLLSHYPYAYSWWKLALNGFKKDAVKVAGKRPKDQGKWLIHGHIHSGGHRGGAWTVNKRQINIGVDVWDYYPVSEQEISNIIQRAESK